MWIASTQETRINLLVRFELSVDFFQLFRNVSQIANRAQNPETGMD